MGGEVNVLQTSLVIIIIVVVAVVVVVIIIIIIIIITSLAKEVMFLVELVSLSVCLFVCLSVDNITQKVMNGLG